MTKLPRNDGGSLVLDRYCGPSRLWPAFSGAAFRRKLLDTMRCGVYRHRSSVDASVSGRGEKDPKETKATKKGSDRLGELLSLEAPETAVDELEVERKTGVLKELQSVVKRLQSREEKKGLLLLQLHAAIEVRRLAKEDPEARATLAMLGSIPPLVGMLDSEQVDFQLASLYALLNLSIGNDENKAAIVKAGAVHKMIGLLKAPNQSISEAIVANFLGLSALDSNKPVIGSSGAVPFLATVLQAGTSQAKQDALRALYNLSISHANIPYIIETSIVPILIKMLGDMEVSEKILSILSNLVSTREGRKAISETSEAFSILIDVLNWSDAQGCQEKATYILMVMSHKSWNDKQAMIEAGMVASLLELTLLGSMLAQKRASRILESLRVDKGKQVSACSATVSAPLPDSSVNREDWKEEELGEECMSEERRAVKELVQQSLQNNMRRIVKRANLPQDFDPSDRFKSLTVSSTSKSLPF